MMWVCRFDSNYRIIILKLRRCSQFTSHLPIQSDITPFPGHKLASSNSAYKHCEYHSFDTVQTNGATHCVGPVYPGPPPHCSYCFARLVAVGTGAEMVVVVRTVEVVKVDLMEDVTRTVELLLVGLLVDVGTIEVDPPPEEEMAPEA